MKNLTIAGRIGKDAVIRTTQGGDKVTSWSVAVDEGFGDRKRTLWFDASMWGQRGEKLAEYLTKGSNVTVSGELSTREHDGKTYLTIRVNDVTLQGGGQREDRQDSGRGTGSARGQQGHDPENPFEGAYAGRGMDDEIPF